MASTFVLFLLHLLFIQANYPICSLLITMKYDIFNLLPNISRSAGD